MKTPGRSLTTHTRTHTQTQTHTHTHTHTYTTFIRTASACEGSAGHGVGGLPGGGIFPGRAADHTAVQATRARGVRAGGGVCPHTIDNTTCRLTWAIAGAGDGTVYGGQQ